MQDRWAQRVAAAAVQNRQRPSQQRLARTLEVGGVGRGAQTAFYEATLILALPTETGASIQNISVPMVSHAQPWHYRSDDEPASFMRARRCYDPVSAGLDSGCHEEGHSLRPFARALRHL